MENIGTSQRWKFWTHLNDASDDPGGDWQSIQPRMGNLTKVGISLAHPIIHGSTLVAWWMAGTIEDPSARRGPPAI